MDSRLLRPRHPSWLIFHVCFPPWKHPLHSCPVPLSQKLVHKINLKTSLSPTRGEKTTLRANWRQQKSLEYFSKYLFRIWEKIYVMKYVSDVSGPKFVGAQRSEKHESQNRCRVSFFFWGGGGLDVLNLQKNQENFNQGVEMQCKEWFHGFPNRRGILESQSSYVRNRRTPRLEYAEIPWPSEAVWAGWEKVCRWPTEEKRRFKNRFKKNASDAFQTKASDLQKAFKNKDANTQLFAFNSVKKNSLKLGISWVRK